MVSTETANLTQATSDGMEDGDVLDLADDEGWEDLEPDVEAVKVSCLLCDQVSEDIKAVLSHCATTHGLDLVKVQRNLSA